jgi:hypothetical protein
MMPRRFPPPWSVDERAAAFAVCDANGRALAYVYFEEEPGRRSAANLLTKDEARRIAANIAKLPQRTRGESPRPPTPGLRAEFVRGSVEDWLAQKQAEDAPSQRWTFRWAFIAALVLIVMAIVIWLVR